jgi:hypothetical protein
MNAIYGEYFTENFPARSTIQVAALPKNGLVEIELVAVVPSANDGENHCCATRIKSQTHMTDELILLVDERTQYHSTCKMYLEREGYRIISEADGNLPWGNQNKETQSCRVGCYAARNGWVGSLQAFASGEE